jgi:chemotaxis regulatin CheY-phosphate phosphatase CheZ
MAMKQELTPLNEADYEAIESAVMETGRGRWFLAEFSRRNRTADTGMLLEAISRLEHSVGGERATFVAERVRQDLMDMAKAIAQLKIELASNDPEINRFEQATEALDGVVRTTESATSNILEAAEQIQEIAWTLREAGAESEACDVLDQRAADIYTACSFQDLTAQRTKKVVLTMRSIEGRINGLVDAWNTGEPSADDSASADQQSSDERQIQRRHLYSPVGIPRQQLAMDEIDLVMRDDQEALQVMNEYPSQLPILDSGLNDTAAHHAADVSVDDHASDIMMVESVEAQTDHDMPDTLPEADSVADAPARRAVNGGPSLAEIDAWPASRKIEVFS